MYFANIWLFDASESLPWLQIVLGVVFFLIVAQFLWTRSSCVGNRHKSCINHKALLPIGTAICWTIFFVGNTWFVKTNTMTPIQSVFATESAVFVFALLYYAIRFRWDWSDVYRSFDHQRDIVPLVLV
jgi:hypothetical protein